MSGKALVCKLGSHIPIEGADRIVQVSMFGETVITQKTNKEGDLGLLFDMETALCKEYAGMNNMFRNSNLNTDKTAKGYLEDSGRIRPIKLKGVKVSALWMPISSLSKNEDRCPDVGQEIDTFLGLKICEKYIPKSTQKAANLNKGAGRKGSIRKEDLVPTFKEHFDTSQWSRNTHAVKEGDIVYITEKLHGTSSRAAYVPAIRIKSFWERLLNSVGIKTPETEYRFVVGSRRVVKSIGGEKTTKDGYYNEDLWSQISREFFEGKLYKGETVYFEIVGYTPGGQQIMPSVPNIKLKPFLEKSEYKNFISKYTDTTTFSYGCTPEENPYKIFVYRITRTNEDGDSLDLSWEQTKVRCEKLGVTSVPELAKLMIGDDYTTFEMCKNIVQELTDAESRYFPAHVREGVCVRIESGSTIPNIFKSKSFIFKVLEGIVKDNSDSVDIEESN